MNSPRRMTRTATWMGVLLGSLCALLLAAAGAHASDQYGAVTEEFHKTYPRTADGRVSLENINGPVHIAAWDRNEVKVDAIKRANSKEQLDAAQIEVDAGKDYVSIETKYRDHNLIFDNDDGENNPASVEYTLTVPRGARLDKIKLINGSLDISGVAGEVEASCINGRLEAKDLRGRMELSTINGKLEANLTRLSGQTVELKSVNGEVELTIPSDTRAEVDASTVSGSIENDFGMRVNHHRYVGEDMRGELGGGGAHVKLSNVNGRIDLRHANDGKAMSTVKSFGRDDGEI